MLINIVAEIGLTVVVGSAGHQMLMACAVVQDIDAHEVSAVQFSYRHGCGLICMQVDIGDGVLLNHAYRHLVLFAPLVAASQQTSSEH